VSSERSGLHGDVKGVAVGPAALHKVPLVRWVLEEAVERKIAPPSTRDAWITPEHGPRLGRVTQITLVEDVLGDLVLGALEGDRIRSGGEFVGPWSLLSNRDVGSCAYMR